MIAGEKRRKNSLIINGQKSIYFCSIRKQNSLFSFERYDALKAVVVNFKKQLIIDLLFIFILYILIFVCSESILKRKDMKKEEKFDFFFKRSSLNIRQMAFRAFSLVKHRK